MSEHVLDGCRTQPLSSYLKGLAVLRLVSEQADPSASASWHHNRLVLDTRISREELLSFFLDQYSPTPLVAPWNGGSGFHPGDKKDGITAIRHSTDPRFASYRQVIKAIKQLPEAPPSFETLDDITRGLRAAIEESRPGNTQDKLQDQLDQVIDKGRDARPFLGVGLDDDIELSELEHAATDKTVPDRMVAANAWWGVVKKARTICGQRARSGGKNQLLTACRASLPDEALVWIDAVYSINDDGEPAYNPLLGSGGNEGRLDYTNNFMQRTSELLLLRNRDEVAQLLEAALFDAPVSGLLKAAVGQYDPGRSGGFNQGPGVEHKDFTINPWDYVLTLEGTVLLAGSLARRQRAGARGQLTIPFTVRASHVGYTSSDENEESRAETWMPIWSRPAGLTEVATLFAEGRSDLGRRQARSGLDFSRAVGSLGTDRGFDQFVRYIYLKRRGDSYVALPAGQLDVHYRPALRILDELDPCLQKVDQFLRRFSSLPATFGRARRAVDEAIYTCCESPDTGHFRGLVRAIGRLEYQIAMRDRSRDPGLNAPITGLTGEWISLCDDGSPEVRIAAALSSIHRTGDVGPLRSYSSGVDAGRPWTWAASGSQQHWMGSNLVERLGQVLQRRLMDADRLSARHTPLDAALPLAPDDVMPFLNGQTDDMEIEALYWGFTWIRLRDPDQATIYRRWGAPTLPVPLSRTWCLFQTLLNPRLKHHPGIRSESRIAPILLAGRVDEAADIARRRLRVSDLQPFDVAFEVGALDPARLAASLLIPVRGWNRITDLVLAPTADQNQPSPNELREVT